MKIFIDTPAAFFLSAVMTAAAGLMIFALIVHRPWEVFYKRNRGSK